MINAIGRDMIKQVQKCWGAEEWLVNNNLYCCKWLYLDPDARCSLHFHKNKTEDFYLESGKIKIETYQICPEHLTIPPEELLTVVRGNLLTQIMKPGDSIHIPNLCVHRFTGIFQSKILEVSTHHDDEDSYRLLPSERK